MPILSFTTSCGIDISTLVASRNDGLEIKKIKTID
jgi:hypothetical protein